MKKNSYIVVTVSENGKYYAYMIKHNNSNNLLNIANIKGILHANICDTKKKQKKLLNNGTKVISRMEHICLIHQNFRRLIDYEIYRRND